MRKAIKLQAGFRFTIPEDMRPKKWKEGDLIMVEEDLDSLRFTKVDFDV